MVYEWESEALGGVHENIGCFLFPFSGRAMAAYLFEIVFEN